MAGNYRHTHLYSVLGFYHKRALEAYWDVDESEELVGIANKDAAWQEVLAVRAAMEALE